MSNALMKLIANSKQDIYLSADPDLIMRRFTPLYEDPCALLVYEGPLEDGQFMDCDGWLVDEVANISLNDDDNM